MHLYFTVLYIYFSCRLYTTSKKECTEVCDLVHSPTNSIAFDCFHQGKRTTSFLLLCVFLSPLRMRNVPVQAVHDDLSIHLKDPMLDISVPATALGFVPAEFSGKSLCGCRHSCLS